ncbi:TonB family protein [Thiorhodococcus drewsii AZ1]|uniref:TonB family protein n=1 Tax=Thiorhodococcus drewsii AZ1 TaxID=765913 RepID=G2E1C6_9GAMM|nr:energy transducer TonB [Thiorhodococcus drewsii]EGV31223.1 TonB family protein [Thiorhodococcus drewsii AZ1]
MDSRLGEQELPPALRIHHEQTHSPVFILALIGAGLLHLVALLALNIEPPKSPPIPETALEILVLTEGGHTTDYAAPDAALAQRTQTGASPTGKTALSSPGEQIQALDPTPEETPPDPIPTVTEEVVETAPESEPKPTPPREAELDVLAAKHPDETLAELPPTRPPIDAAGILASQSREIARLTADLEAQSSAYARRVRRKSISASTREFRYASYLGAWARKVERIGNLNYPQAAKEAHLYGSLILHVAIRSDGSVERIRIVRSSGSDLLDEAAIQIVELAAPYSPFPPDIAAETDVLDIIRTWQFMRGDVLGWER